MYKYLISFKQNESFKNPLLSLDSSSFHVLFVQVPIYPTKDGQLELTLGKLQVDLLCVVFHLSIYVPLMGGAGNYDQFKRATFKPLFLHFPGIHPECLNSYYSI